MKDNTDIYAIPFEVAKTPPERSRRLYLRVVWSVLSHTRGNKTVASSLQRLSSGSAEDTMHTTATAARAVACILSVGRKIQTIHR